MLECINKTVALATRNTVKMVPTHTDCLRNSQEINSFSGLDLHVKCQAWQRTKALLHKQHGIYWREVYVGRLPNPLLNHAIGKKTCELLKLSRTDFGTLSGYITGHCQCIKYFYNLEITLNDTYRSFLEIGKTHLHILCNCADSWKRQYLHKNKLLLKLKFKLNIGKYCHSLFAIFALKELIISVFAWAKAHVRRCQWKRPKTKWAPPIFTEVENGTENAIRLSYCALVLR